MAQSHCTGGQAPCCGADAESWPLPIPQAAPIFLCWLLAGLGAGRVHLLSRENKPNRDFPWPTEAAQENLESSALNSCAHCLVSLCELKLWAVGPWALKAEGGWVLCYWFAQENTTKLAEGRPLNSALWESHKEAISAPSCRLGTWEAGWQFCWAGREISSLPPGELGEANHPIDLECAQRHHVCINT